MRVLPVILICCAERSAIGLAQSELESLEGYLTDWEIVHADDYPISAGAVNVSPPGLDLWSNAYYYASAGVQSVGSLASYMIWGSPAHSSAEDDIVVQVLDECQNYVLGNPNSEPPSDHQMESIGRCEMNSVQETEANSTVRIFFVRHAESTWNDYTRSMAYQLIANRQAWLTDAHLSRKGLKGGLEVRDWLFGAPCETRDQCFLAGFPHEQDEQRRVVFATSNLRRAVMTTLIAFWNRLRPETPNQVPVSGIHTLSSLQEMVTNIDSQPVTPPKQLPYLTFGNGRCPFQKEHMRNLFVTDCHIQDENAAPAEQRRDILADFCNWAARQTVAQEASDLVLVGHSIWIRKFFQRFLTHPGPRGPAESALTSELHKMSNEAVLKFDLKFTETGSCEILPATAEFVRGQMSKRFGIAR